MPPVEPPRKDDGPACRVCGCTENNACLVQFAPSACWWVDVDSDVNDKNGWLCSACSGTAADMAEVIDRGMNILLRTVSVAAAERVVAMALAAKVRYEARQKAENRG